MLCFSLMKPQLSFIHISHLCCHHSPSLYLVTVLRQMHVFKHVPEMTTDQATTCYLPKYCPYHSSTTPRGFNHKWGSHNCTSCSVNTRDNRIFYDEHTSKQILNKITFSFQYPTSFFFFFIKNRLTSYPFLPRGTIIVFASKPHRTINHYYMQIVSIVVICLCTLTPASCIEMLALD